MSDKIEIEILEDGTIKTSTDKVSMANHSSAEGFLKFVGRLCGGLVQRVRKGGKHHGHAHGEHEHEHGDEHHHH